MRSAGVAVLAGLVVLRVFGFTRRWPWRVIDLTSVGSQHQEKRHSTPVRFSGRHQRQITAALPTAADLLRIAVSAGHSLHGAIASAAEFGEGPVCDALGLADHRFRHGSSLVNEIAALPDRLGPAARSFAATLVMAHSSGSPLASTLQRLADAERRRARRQIEERVRRLPVLLLAPLVGLILPAFVVLTIVPVVLVTAEIDLAGSTSVANFPPSPATEEIHLSGVTE